MHARMNKTCMYICTVFMYVCNHSDVIPKRVVGPSTYIHSAHTDEVRTALHQWLLFKACMYVCMREYGHRREVSPQVENATSGQGDLLIDILQVNLKGSYRRATCFYACMYVCIYVWKWKWICILYYVIICISEYECLHHHCLARPTWTLCSAGWSSLSSSHRQREILMAGWNRNTYIHIKIKNKLTLGNCDY